MQLAKRFDFENEQTLLFTRVGYVVAQLTCLACYYYVSIQVRPLPGLSRRSRESDTPTHTPLFSPD